MQFVESKNLKPGMRLAKPIYNKMGVLLYDRNTLLSIQSIKSIENFGLIGIFILEPAEPLPPLSQEDLQFEQFQTIYMFRVKEIMDRLMKEERPNTLHDLVEGILTRYGSLDHKMNFTQNLRSSADFVYKHSISTAILAAMVAHVLKCTHTEKYNLVTAALLYDLGYLFVPRTVLDKGDSLASEDKKVIDECRRKGYELLSPESNKFDLPKETLNMLPQIHNAIYTGNRNAYKENNWKIGSLIIIIADMFDRLTAMNLNHPPISEVAAMRYLHEYPELYHPKAVAALAHCIHILPAGCSVDLSNGHKGIVLVENPNDFLAPLILDINNNQLYDLASTRMAQKMQIIDIMKTMDNRIVIDTNTLKSYVGDSTIQKTMTRYQQRRAQKLAEGIEPMK